MPKYDKSQHVIVEIEYKGRIVPVHRYGSDQYMMLINGDQLKDGTPTTRATCV